jgi:SAM-dependent methyltransferase
LKVKWHSYKYLPYEKELASREMDALFGDSAFLGNDGDYVLSVQPDSKAVDRLTYFSQVAGKSGVIETIQSRLENASNGQNRRQSTRYSVHGLHEYKGKFNPQIAKAILNIFCVSEEDFVLDPFCGSGTTLIEAAQLGCRTFGTDINPLAVYIAEAKLLALRTPAKRLAAILLEISARRPNDIEMTGFDGSKREIYLALWFEEHFLSEIEGVFYAINACAGKARSFFLCVASDLLREYSNQEPADLRIRRRKTALPDKSFWLAFVQACEAAIAKLDVAQKHVGTGLPPSNVALGDVRCPDWPGAGILFDAAITSPPYAMALPYIDTQRLSLVWLGLVEPNGLHALEAELIGSRELRGASRRSMSNTMSTNEAGLPEAEAHLCVRLQSALEPEDGFRRRAVPALLYRYFQGMRDAFVNVRNVMRPDGRFALIVGQNRTTIGGSDYQIDTPTHLANIAGSVGWRVAELMPLQTYRRYGLHASNAITSETLLILQK